MSVNLRVETPMGLLAYLRAHHPSYPSVKALKRAIDQKRCKVNGSVECFSTHTLKKGDKIEILLGPSPEIMPTPILFENEECIAYHKSAHTLSDPPQGLFAVHRLDKETSGVLLFAKSLEAQEKISGLFADRKVSKCYLAIVDGQVDEEKWTTDNFLGKIESYDGGAVYGPVSPKRGKRAITHFRRLKTSKRASLLLCEPITGRTHQIRAHLASSHPILGDWQYARKFKCPHQPKRHLLHAYSLAILYPNTNFSDCLGIGEHIIAPLPVDFIQSYAEIFEDPHCQDLRNWRCAADLSSS